MKTRFVTKDRKREVTVVSFADSGQWFRVQSIDGRGFKDRVWVADVKTIQELANLVSLEELEEVPR